MNTRVEHGGDTADLDAAAQLFSSIAEELKGTYAAIERRAERVEAELARTNKELERKVRELDEVGRALAAILECLPTGVVVRDADGVVARTNPAAEELLAGDVSRLGELECAAGSVATFAHADGRKRRVQVRLADVRGADGTSLGSLVILDDRTEVERLASRLHVQDKMAAIGTLASGIAHEIRNPLNAIAGFATLLESRLDDEQLGHWASLVSAGAFEIDSIVTGLVTMASPEALEASRVEVREVVDAAVEQALGRRADRALWPIEVDVRTEYVRGDAVKLRQALRNLISNAADVQRDGGAIRVLVEEDGDDVLLTVDDDGPGVPQELRSRILEPFFTTRAEGTGLGLALTHTIAQLHGGVVEIDDAAAPLRGARFRIRIPQPTTGRPV
ncbi:MAG: ATP-binding protein [Planctomycetota bacterium]